jgi:acyl-CoA thioesterase-1
MILTRLTLLAFFLVSASANPLKVACVGDSITEGAGLSIPGTQSYPARLQQLLGTNYLVKNYGVSGRTLLKQGDFPYWKEPAFTNSHTFGPNIVIIQLGTNDSKPQNWRYGTNFVSDYDDLIASYASLSNSPIIYVCTPCPVYGAGAYDIRPSVIATNIVPLAHDIATRHSLPLIDLQTRLAGHSEWFPDTVHPNSRGMAVMSAIMFSALTPAPASSFLPSVKVLPLPGRSAIVSWPAEWGSFVAQTASVLKATNTAWTVLDGPIPTNVQGSIRATNSAIGARFFRLWQP